MARVTIAVHLDRNLWRQLAAHPEVRVALNRQARLVAAVARNIAQAEDVDTAITVEDGARPLGRPYSRVVSSDGEGEFGTSRRRRHRVLGRAAGFAKS